MKTIKLMACAALAAACVAGISGCGSKESSESKGAAYSTPKVAEGSILALAGRSAKTTSLAPLLKKYKMDDAFSETNMAQMPDEMKDVVKELELDKAEFSWLLLTVGDVSAAVKGEGVPDVALALATTLNLDKAVAACEKKLKDDKAEGKPAFKKATVAGVSAYEIHSKDFMAGDKEVVPCVASLDGKLIVAASSAAVLEKQIALYRDGKGVSSDFSSFALGANDILRVKVMKVGENVKKSLPDPDMLQMVGGFIPDGDKIVLGLGSVELALGASSDGKDAKFDVTVDTASDADAEKLRAFVKDGLTPLGAMVKDAEDEGMKLASGALKAVKVAGEGKVASLSVACPADDLLKFVSGLVK